MKLNKTELKKILYDFNSISNRLMKAEPDDYKDVLRKFISFLSSCPVIQAYINDCGAPTIVDIETEVKEVSSSYGDSIFSTGSTSAEETANIFAILKTIATSEIEIDFNFRGYSRSGEFDTIVKGFNQRFVFILIRNIEGYLTKMGIDMGLDESTQYNITVHNGQVNLASDSAVINATVNNGVNQVELQALIEKVLSESKTGLKADEVEVVAESVEAIEQELKQEKPKKSVLKGILTTLEGIKGTVEFFAAVASLATFVKQFL